MSSRWRRFEVLLPLKFNDGRDVPPIDAWYNDKTQGSNDHHFVAFISAILRRMTSICSSESSAVPFASNVSVFDRMAMVWAAS